MNRFLIFGLLFSFSLFAVEPSAVKELALEHGFSSVKINKEIEKDSKLKERGKYLVTVTGESKSFLSIGEFLADVKEKYNKKIVNYERGSQGAKSFEIRFWDD